MNLDQQNYGDEDRVSRGKHKYWTTSELAELAGGNFP